MLGLGDLDLKHNV